MGFFRNIGNALKAAWETRGSFFKPKENLEKMNDWMIDNPGVIDNNVIGSPNVDDIGDEINKDDLPQHGFEGVGNTFNPAEFFEYYNEYAKKATEEQRAWAAEQAAKQMDFQKDMASTQYQRAAQDMQKAGLNPYLLMSSGAGMASAPSGAMATSQTQDIYNVNDTLKRDEMLMSLLASVIGNVSGLVRHFNPVKRPK